MHLCFVLMQIRIENSRFNTFKPYCKGKQQGETPERLRFLQCYVEEKQMCFDRLHTKRLNARWVLRKN